jgi:hypothetical protein
MGHRDMGNGKLPDGEETNKGIWVPAGSHIVSGHDLPNLKQVALFEIPDLFQGHPGRDSTIKAGCQKVDALVNPFSQGFGEHKLFADSAVHCMVNRTSTTSFKTIWSCHHRPPFGRNFFLLYQTCRDSLCHGDEKSLLFPNQTGPEFHYLKMFNSFGNGQEEQQKQQGQTPFPQHGFPSFYFFKEKAYNAE